jgi:two-component system LytT family sensor kinase
VTRAEEGWDERAGARAAPISVPLVPAEIPLVPGARPEEALSPKLRPVMDALERRTEAAVEPREGGEEEPAAPRGASKGRMRERALPWIGLVLTLALVGLLNFGVVVTDDLTTGDARSWKFPFLWEMTGAFTLLPLIPLVVLLCRRFPLRSGSWLRRLPLHLGAMVLFAVTHTLLMWGSRTVLYRLLGWGRYDYGDMRYRFFMEGHKQLLVYGAVYAVVELFAYLRRAKERELAAAHLQRQLTEARLAALKMQLNPHFLFNTLNLISSLAYDRPEVAEAMIERLSEFLRLALRSGGVQEVPLFDELSALQAYLEIMQARFEGRLAVIVELADEARGALVPHLILQPLVENAVTHSMAVPGREGRIRIGASVENGRLRLVVKDNGPGLAPHEAGALTRRDLERGRTEGNGIGLANTEERLRHLYGEAARLTLESPPEGGARVTLEIPFRPRADEGRP